MRRTVASVAAALFVLLACPLPSAATTPPGGGEGDTATSTLPTADAEESGAAVPAPAAAPEVPLLQIPNGCPEPPVASVVFVGRVIAKDYRSARYQIQQVRAGSPGSYAVGNLIDVRYGTDVEFLDVNQDYLVGAVPEGAELVLTSKVREAKPVLGGNAIIGLTEKASACPPIEDPVRTLHLDGTEIEAGILTAMSNDKSDLLLAFGKPLAAVIAVIVALVLLRWVITGFFAAARRAAEAEYPPSA